jgi:hypothetical protein
MYLMCLLLYAAPSHLYARSVAHQCTHALYAYGELVGLLEEVLLPRQHGLQAPHILDVFAIVCSAPSHLYARSVAYQS